MILFLLLESHCNRPRIVITPDVLHNTILRMDAEIYNEMNAVVQAEPSLGENSETRGVLSTIGIKKWTSI